MEEAKKTRYSDEELEEFRKMISEQLERTKREYEDLMTVVRTGGSNDTADSDLSFDPELDNVADQLSKQEASDMAHKKLKTIRLLEAALVRIRYKTYGIDASTGELIPAGRLRLIPWATSGLPRK